MMKCTFTVCRSPAWLRLARHRTGDNIPEMIHGDIEMSDLSEESRSFLLVYGNGTYLCAINTLYLDWQGAWSRGAWASEYHLMGDCDVITADVIDRALCDAQAWQVCAYARIQAEAAAGAVAKAEAEAKAAAKAAAIAAAEELLAGQLMMLREQLSLEAGRRHLLSQVLSRLDRASLDLAIRAAWNGRETESAFAFADSVSLAATIPLGADEE